MEGEGVRVIVIEKPSFLLPPEREWWPSKASAVSRSRSRRQVGDPSPWPDRTRQWTRLLPLKFIGSPLAGSVGVVVWGCPCSEVNSCMIGVRQHLREHDAAIRMVCVMVMGTLDYGLICPLCWQPRMQLRRSTVDLHCPFVPPVWAVD